MKILSGKDVSQKIYDQILSYENFKFNTPKLLTIRFGNNKDDILYEKMLIKKCNTLNLNVDNLTLSCNEKESYVYELINNINNDEGINGVIVFGGNSDFRKIISDNLDPIKDIDGITIKSAQGVYLNPDKEGKDFFSPCTPKACIRILDHYNVDLEGKNVVVIGRSLVVGKPLSLMLLSKNSTVTIAHSKSFNLKNITNKADIIISAIGLPSLIDSSYFNNNSILIDVGINYVDGKLVGDIVEKDKEKSLYYTSVPGGVGSVTTAVLLENLVKAYFIQNNKRPL